MLSPVISSRNVVLPEPLGPRISQCSFLRRVQLRSCKTRFSPQPTLTPRISISAASWLCDGLPFCKTALSWLAADNWLLKAATSDSRDFCAAAFLSAKTFSYSLRSPQKEISPSVNSTTLFIAFGISWKRSIPKIIRGKALSWLELPQPAFWSCD